MQWWGNHVLLGCFLIGAKLYVGRAVWARRWTLRASSEHTKLTERTITVALILMMAAMFLMSPAGAATVGNLLHTAFGQWNVNIWIGHCLFMSAAAMVVVNVKTRLCLSHDSIRTNFKRQFELPMTIVAPVSLALLCTSPNADRYWPDGFECPTDRWLDAYWTIGCSFLIWLAIVGAMPAVLSLRLDRRNRCTGNCYLVAIFATVAVCLLRIATSWADQDDWAQFFWVADAAVPVVLGYASARSWRQKVRWLSPAVRL